MAKVELKQPVIDEIKAYADEAKSIVLIDYRGLTVAQDTELRSKLREEGVIYKVYKNTMLNLAFKGTEYEEITKDLAGPTAVAFSNEDETVAARVIKKASKTMPALEFKSGIVDGVYYDTEGIKAIASIPSRDELLSKLLGSLQAPISNLARVLKQIAEQKEEAA